MAFCNSFGGLMRQTISRNGASNGPVPVASTYNAIRCMSEMSQTKLFIGGLSYTIDDQSLRDAFSGFGGVVDARDITDRDSGRSRGFRFVNFSSDEFAKSALSAMDGLELNGRNIRVSYANDRPCSGFGCGPGGYRGWFGGTGAADDGF